MSVNTKTNNPSINSGYRQEIDGLRAFAVVAVIINHFNKEILPGGYLGVDIFFVISGFVITSSLYQRPSKNFRDFISGFYERRIKRLVPALSLFVLVMSILICLFNPVPVGTLRTGLTALFGLSNLYLLKGSTDYFAQSTQLNVFTHTWSLGVEEQFYILFPFLIWFSGYGRQSRKGSRNLFLIVGTITIASLVGFLILYPINQSAAYFLMLTRFWEMAAGCLMFIGFQKRSTFKHFLERIPPLLVLLLIIAVMYLPMYLATTSTFAVVILSAILLGSLKKRTAAYKFFTNSKVVYLGLISYSLYLWHWGVLSLSRWTIGIHWWTIPFQVALMLYIAIASYKWIETPLRKGSWFGKRWKTLLIGLGVIISLTLKLLFLSSKPLTGKLFTGNQNNVWNMKIFREKKIIHNQILPTIYLLGDSHAGHYGAVLTDLAQTKKLNLIMHPQGDGLKLMNNNWDEFISAPLREYKNKFKNGDTIIFSAHLDKYQNNHDWTKKYKTFMKKTKNKKLKYILISPTPIFKRFVGGYACQKEWHRPKWALSSNCFEKIKKSDFLASNNQPISLIKKFLLANPEIIYIDAFSVVCPNSFCKTHDQNSLIYKDKSHLSSYGAIKLRDKLEKNL